MLDTTLLTKLSDDHWLTMDGFRLFVEQENGRISYAESSTGNYDDPCDTMVSAVIIKSDAEQLGNETIYSIEALPIAKRRARTSSVACRIQTEQHRRELREMGFTCCVESFIDWRKEGF